MRCHHIREFFTFLQIAIRKQRGVEELEEVDLELNKLQSTPNEKSGWNLVL